MTLSPQYAISKPDMSHDPIAKRIKNQLKYGRKSTIDTRAYDSKSRCSGTHRFADNDLEDEESLKTHQQDATKIKHNGLCRISQKTDRDDCASKHSLINYFKPIRLEKVETRCDDVEPQNTMQNFRSSTQRSRSSRKTRLLRLRAICHVASNNYDCRSEDGDQEAPETRRNRTTNQRANSEKAVKESISRIRTKSTSSKSPGTMVQTTLNISTGAAFAQCKVCDTVWNPLYPDDVKYHTRRHALLTSAKRNMKDTL